MKNKLIDLNNHLFAEIERLNDEDLNGDKLKQEIERSKAMANVAKNIIDNGKLALAAKVELGNMTPGKVPAMFEIEKK